MQVFWSTNGSSKPPPTRPRTKPVPGPRFDAADASFVRLSVRGDRSPAFTATYLVKGLLGPEQMFKGQDSTGTFAGRHDHTAPTPRSVSRRSRLVVRRSVESGKCDAMDQYSLQFGRMPSRWLGRLRPVPARSTGKRAWSCAAGTAYPVQRLHHPDNANGHRPVRSQTVRKRAARPSPVPPLLARKLGRGPIALHVDLASGKNRYLVRHPHRGSSPPVRQPRHPSFVRQHAADLGRPAVKLAARTVRHSGPGRCTHASRPMSDRKLDSKYPVQP